MANLITVNSFSDDRGSLSVVEKILPFEIKRVFYIYNVDDSVRGNHRHHKTTQAAICINGSCIITNNDGTVKDDFLLDSPNKCLILHPKDYHSMHTFTKGAVLLVLASEFFNPEDYIFEPYP